MDDAAPPVPALKAALTARCPRCGEGPLFRGPLALRERCEKCGLDYKFIDTGETIEIQQSFHDEPLTEAVHPERGETMAVKKVFLPVGITFKGGGFYKTDSRKGGGSAEGSSRSSSESSSPSGSTSGSGSASTSTASGASSSSPSSTSSSSD